MITLINCHFDVSESSKWQPFVGESCFPLSPVNLDNLTEVDNEKDQLGIIIDILGQLNKDDKSFLVFDKQWKHLDRFIGKYDKIDFTQEYEELPREMNEILS